MVDATGKVVKLFDELIAEGEKIKHVEKWEKDRYEHLLDLRGCYVAPGLVDIHVHGGGGNDAMDPKGLEGLSRFLSEGGVTSFLPTTHTAPQWRARAKIWACKPECFTPNQSLRSTTR